MDPLSIDHKPTCEDEMNRIVSAGGWVQFNRVNGNLALSRAFGDFVFKRNEKRSATEQIVIAYPDVQTRPLTSDLEFAIMACDGVWDVMTNEEVIEFIRRRIFYRREPVAICEELITRCLAPDCQMGCGIGCDNMTVILICYLNGSTYEEFCDRVSNVYQMIPGNMINSTNHNDGVDHNDDHTATRHIIGPITDDYDGYDGSHNNNNDDNSDVDDSDDESDENSSRSSISSVDNIDTVNNTNTITNVNETQLTSIVVDVDDDSSTIQTSSINGPKLSVLPIDHHHQQQQRIIQSNNVHQKSIVKPSHTSSSLINDDECDFDGSNNIVVNNNNSHINSSYHSTTTQCQH